MIAAFLIYANNIFADGFVLYRCITSDRGSTSLQAAPDIISECGVIINMGKMKLLYFIRTHSKLELYTSIVIPPLTYEHHTSILAFI